MPVTPAAKAKLVPARCAPRDTSSRRMQSTIHAHRVPETPTGSTAPSVLPAPRLTTRRRARVERASALVRAGLAPTAYPNTMPMAAPLVPGGSTRMESRGVLVFRVQLGRTTPCIPRRRSILDVLRWMLAHLVPAAPPLRAAASHVRAMPATGWA
jgi:hypothetical protein